MRSVWYVAAENVLIIIIQTSSVQLKKNERVGGCSK